MMSLDIDIKESCKISNNVGHSDHWSLYVACSGLYNCEFLIYIPYSKLTTDH